MRTQLWDNVFGWACQTIVPINHWARLEITTMKSPAGKLETTVKLQRAKAKKLFWVFKAGRDYAGVLVSEQCYATAGAVQQQHAIALKNINNIKERAIASLSQQAA